MIALIEGGDYLIIFVVKVAGLTEGFCLLDSVSVFRNTSLAASFRVFFGSCLCIINALLIEGFRLRKQIPGHHHDCHWPFSRT